MEETDSDAGCCAAGDGMQLGKEWRVASDGDTSWSGSGVYRNRWAVSEVYCIALRTR